MSSFGLAPIAEGSETFEDMEAVGASPASGSGGAAGPAAAAAAPQPLAAANGSESSTPRRGDRKNPSLQHLTPGAVKAADSDAGRKKMQAAKGDYIAMGAANASVVASCLLAGLGRTPSFHTKNVAYQFGREVASASKAEAAARQPARTASAAFKSECNTCSKHRPGQRDLAAGGKAAKRLGF